ncbi:zf-HC2 domain-containing protein [Nocardia abscessus]|uniref:Zf-HC2 domain-containing protein n=1 Tax=Nocardia abscessus TaxID=120957 RepID=A0ABS0C2Z1_9NOCA|nr:zf-HC2 domain-containing protein [Nocardia abscessus]MBF6224754.1 zf-HC2 domain-containing protein [Nocardia abscessus]
MTDITDDYTTWDAAYVLGSLTRDERLRYESHLAGCPDCRAAVAELAGLPGMLALVETDIATAMIEPPAQAGEFAAESAPPPMPSLPPPPRLADAAERRRRRSGWTSVGIAVASAAAAAAIAVPIAVSLSGSDDSPQPGTSEQAFVERQMTPLEPTPVSASFKLLPAGDRTRLVMSCSYPPGEQSRYNWDLALYVTSTSGQQQKLDEWPAGPGTELTIDRTIDGTPDQVRSVEIRAANTGKVLLTGSI